MTDWLRHNEPRIRGFHLLHRSKLISMGIAVANLALGRFIRGHSDLTTFEAELIAAGGESLARARRPTGTGR